MNASFVEFSIPVLFIDNSEVGNDREKQQQFINEFFLRTGCLFIPFNSEAVKKSEIRSWHKLQLFVKHGLNQEEEIIAIVSSATAIQEGETKVDLAKSLMEAHLLGAKFLAVGTFGFKDTVYIKDNLFWVSEIDRYAIVFIYRSVFNKILERRNIHGRSTTEQISSLTINKFVLHPFIVYLRDYNNQTDSSLRHESRILDKIKVVHGKYRDMGQVLSNRNMNPTLNGIFRNKLLSDLSDLNMVPLGLESHIVVLVPFHNAGRFLSECVNSLMNQQYNNFEVILLDDCASDGATSDLMDSAKNNFKIVRSDRRRFALANIVDCLVRSEFSANDIIIVVDGDDYLYHNQVLSMVNSIYLRTSALLSFGQYYSTDNIMGHCRPYSEDEFRMLRQLDWRASHLKTFKYGLFLEVLRQDPEQSAFRDKNGEFYEMTYDIALMTPMLEVAGFRKCYFNRQVNYIYRVHSNNDAVRNRGLQVQIENEIKKKPKFNCKFN